MSSKSMVLLRSYRLQIPVQGWRKTIEAVLGKELGSYSQDYRRKHFRWFVRDRYGPRKKLTRDSRLGNPRRLQSLPTNA